MKEKLYHNGKLTLHAYQSMLEIFAAVARGAERMKDDSDRAYEILNSVRGGALRTLVSVRNAGHTELFNRYLPSFAIFHFHEGQHDLRFFSDNHKKAT